MDYRGVALEKILREDEQKEFVLPNFQRTFVWTRKQQTELLASFIANIPIGNILIVNGKKNDFASRFLCQKEGVARPSGKCKFLLDGQQRISCLKTAFTDLYDKGDPDDIRNELYPQLRYRWSLKLRPEDNEEDIFGWSNLNYEPSEVDPKAIVEMIRSDRIHPDKNSDRWFHPKFDGNKQKVGKCAADEFCVPLWELFHHDGKRDKTPAHRWALEAIATARIQELRAKVEGDMDQTIELLKPAMMDADSLYLDVESVAEEKITGALAQLKANWVKEVSDALNELLTHEIPTTELPRSEVGRAVAVFENINKGGTTLSVFDLVVATSAMKATNEVSLRKRIRSQLQKPVQFPSALCDTPQEFNAAQFGALDKKDNIAKLIQDQFLNMLSIFAHYQDDDLSTLQVKDLKKDRQLSVEASDINLHASKVVASLIRALAFLNSRCGLVSLGGLSYGLMLVPIAYVLSDDENWSDQRVIDGLEYWYWSSLLGGFYRDRQNSTAVEDLQSLHSWVRQRNGLPFAERLKKVLDADEYSSREVLLMKNVEDYPVRKAVRNGIAHYILSTEPKDWLPKDGYRQVKLSPVTYLNGWETQKKNGNDPIDLGDVQQHHIVPLGSVTKLGESTKKLRKDKKNILNSPLNMTPISRHANQLISSRSPDRYLSQIKELTVYGHFLPAGLAEKVREWDWDSEKETWKDPCESLLEDRYLNLKQNLIEELEKLRSSADNS